MGHRCIKKLPKFFPIELEQQNNPNEPQNDSNDLENNHYTGT